MTLRMLAVAIQIAMPNPDITPGAAQQVTAAQVCVPGYSSKARAVSIRTKKLVFKEYGIKYAPRQYEVDHLISLELGGSNDIKNLWPEPYSPKPGAKEKDEVEDFLHRQVCSGKMSLLDAQKQIATNWYTVYQRIHGPQNP